MSRLKSLLQSSALCDGSIVGVIDSAPPAALTSIRDIYSSTGRVTSIFTRHHKVALQLSLELATTASAPNEPCGELQLKSKGLPMKACRENHPTRTHVPDLRSAFCNFDLFFYISQSARFIRSPFTCGQLWPVPSNPDQRPRVHVH